MKCCGHVAKLSFLGNRNLFTNKPRVPRRSSLKMRTYFDIFESVAMSLNCIFPNMTLIENLKTKIMLQTN